MKTDHFILLLAALLLGGCTMVNPGYGWAPAYYTAVETTTASYRVPYIGASGMPYYVPTYGYRTSYCPF